MRNLQEGGEVETDIFDTSVDIEIDAFIPSSYIKNEIQKLEAYKTIASVCSQSDRADMEDELTDRYGDPPRSVGNLLDIALIKSMAHEVYITSISQKKGTVRIDFYPKAKLKVECFPQLLDAFKNRLVLRTGKVPYLEFTPGKAGTQKPLSGSAARKIGIQTTGVEQKLKKAGIVGELLEFLPVMKEIMLEKETPEKEIHNQDA